ncbi:Sensitivity To Red Light Reduced-like protein [Cinnamomum micranthum f. kanehirae]|uniref:Sensitivity To Red Light Reduced-like protein n=1 Tax=Cinnamomum micranthum f. kanehirae TaxID=337451 RepID=A0A443N1G3_9MAGN|nr:Sensitivity To Red Light Reduced-like protein [Cinnamomum micranthum f. kanehirae]
MQMVIYGIGSIDSYEPPRLQLSMAILLSRRFDSVIEGRIEVFDSIISKVELRVMGGAGVHGAKGRRAGAEGGGEANVVLHAALRGGALQQSAGG